jgi:GNAT superfamily N-acetyltransferase
MTRDDVLNYTSREELRDRRPVIIRAIRPDDKGSLIDALNKLSPESLYRRLFSGKRKFSDEEMNQMTAVDFVNVVALVAVLEDGMDRIVGGGRYIRVGPSGTEPRAEVAFLIDDAHQGLGIGSRLFKHLAAIARASGITQFEAEVLPSNAGMLIARASGITQFEAEVLPSNAGMLRVFSRSGLPVAKTVARDSVHLTIDL